MSYADDFHDALAFARAVTNSDFKGADLVFEPHREDPITIAVPLAYMVGALAKRLSTESGVEPEIVWAALAETIDVTGEGREDSDE